MTGKFRLKDEGEISSEAVKQPVRAFVVFKVLVLLALLGVTAYGMLDSGLYGDERWLPVAAGILGVLLVTLFVRRFYEDVSLVGWLLVGLLAVLTTIKGLSMIWTLSDTLTIEELLRSAMYLTAFTLALAALSTKRQLAPAIDTCVLIVAMVAAYGLLQKILPNEYPVASLDGVRVDSTLGYANTTALVLAMGALLALSRMTHMRAAVARGVYAALILAFAVTLYLTVSRGGIGALGIGALALFVLSDKRPQLLANSLLVAAPGGWLFWRMLDTDGLLQVGASGQQRVEAGLTFRADLLISLGAAFVLQTAYSLLKNHYEISPRARRVAETLAVVGAVAVLCAGVFGIVSRYGGPGEAYKPAGTPDVGERLTSLSIGFRADYWAVAWEAWKENPLGGTGAGTFQYTWLQERPGSTGVKQVHNVYLEQATETGVFAFVALAGYAGLLAAYVALAAWRSRSSQRVLLAGMSAALLAYLASSAFEWHWYIPPSTLLFFILSGVAVKAASAEWQDSWAEEHPSEPEGSTPEGDEVFEEEDARQGSRRE